ncbi:MAG: hypothetical protein M3N19_08175 [Candidatus Eremiobacteraeota bacterium]|nr:hypothetical protein [Candidatus Eremiobacteraeota bacterium]
MHQLQLPRDEHDLGTDSEFAIVVSADAPKTITASLRFFSKDQAYEAPFTANILAGMTTVTVQNGKSGPIVQANEATPIVVRLPSSLPVDAVWIDNVTLDGKPALCGALPLMSFGNLAPDQNAAKDASDTDVRTRAGSKAIDAVTIGKWDMHKCPLMLTEASVINYIQPYYPVDEVLGGTARIGIALAPIALLKTWSSSKVRAIPT